MHSKFFLVLLMPTFIFSMEIQPYHSTYSPTPLAQKVMKLRRIIDESETPQRMMERVVEATFSVEENLIQNLKW